MRHTPHETIQSTRVMSSGNNNAVHVDNSMHPAKESLLAWRRFVEKHTPNLAEISIEAAGSAPLFDVRLKVVTGDGGDTCVSIVPGLPQIENALMCIVDDVVTTVKVRYALAHSWDLVGRCSYFLART